MRERSEAGERGGGDGIGVYPSQRDAPRYFRGLLIVVYGGMYLERDDRSGEDLGYSQGRNQGVPSGAMAPPMVNFFSEIPLDNLWI